MKATDLLVGDSIYRADCYDRVVEIRLNGIIGQDSNRGLISFDEIRPIEITPEILEKNGFEGTPTSDLYIEKNLWDKYAIELFPSEGSWLLRITDKTNKYSTSCNKINVYIKYVHELQHALRLCKIDKEIIL